MALKDFTKKPRRSIIFGLTRTFGLTPFIIGDDTTHSGRSKFFSAYNVILAVIILFNAYISEKDARNDSEYNNMSLLIGVAYDAIDVFGNLYICYSLFRSLLQVEVPISAWFRFRQIDRKLGAASIAFNYNRMRKYIGFKIVLYFLFVCMFSALDVVSCARIGIYYTFNFWMMELLPLFYFVFSSLLFGCVALIIFQRYRVVNGLLQELAEAGPGILYDISGAVPSIRTWGAIRVQPKEVLRQKRLKTPIYLMVEISDDSGGSGWKDVSLTKKLKFLKEIHFELYQLMNDFNSAFGYHFLFLFVFSFFGCTINLYFVIIFHLRPFEVEQYLSSTCWSIVLLALTSYIVFHTNLVANEGARTIDLIHSFLIKTSYSDVQVQSELNSFSVQLAQCPVQFRAGGFFLVNSSLLFQFITGVLSSVVFVVQFDKVNFA